MFEKSGGDECSPTLQEFYDGKSIFVTGAAGFVGTVLLETLLRSCPGIKFIYILLRSKKNEQPEVRKENILKKKVFQKTRKETPELIRKIYVIPGDASLPNLGMSEENVKLLIDEVSVVFHCASVINFIMPLKGILVNNVLGLNSIIGLCKQMRKFEALVYTSTGLSNCNHLNYLIKEEVYRLPFHAEKFLDVLKNEDNEKLQELVAHCKPDWPNTYSFSKCLAENVILDTASDLPVAIIRPTAIFCTWKQPIPGYVEENSGMMALAIGVWRGLIKVLNGDPNTKLNLVPVDIVANAHVVAAWSVGTKRCETPLVVNCTATEKLNVKISEFIETMSVLGLKLLVPRSSNQQSVLRLEPNIYMYYILAAYKHFIPAVILDGILKVLGKKPRIFSMYRFFDKVISSMNFAMFHSYEYERKNLEYLDKFIHPEDRKDLYLDFNDATLSEMSQTIPGASPFYDWKIDRKSQSERRKIIYRRHMLISCIQGTFLVTCAVLIYWVFSSIF